MRGQIGSGLTGPGLVRIYVRAEDYFKYVTLRAKYTSGSVLLGDLLKAYEAVHGPLVPKLTESEAEDLKELQGLIGASPSDLVGIVETVPELPKV